jgi:hypothetical protein
MTQQVHEPKTPLPTIFVGLPALLSVPRAAAILGLSRASAYRFAAAGELPCRRIGGRLFIVTSRLESFLNGTDLSE